LHARKQIATLEKEVDKLRTETAVEEEIKLLQDKIMEIGGVRPEARRQKWTA
jgi:structural maintenance of chromosome 4